MRPLIESLGLDVEVGDAGYPAAGHPKHLRVHRQPGLHFRKRRHNRPRQELEKTVYPNDFHFKIAVSGCPNDCIKAVMNDFGILCTVEPVYDESRCISLLGLRRNCAKAVTGACP